MILQFIRQPKCSKLIAVFVMAVLISASSPITAQSTSSVHQFVYPGFVLDFSCNASSPFIQVNSSDLNQQRDEQLQQTTGIETKFITTQRTIVRTVCVDGSMVNNIKVNLTCGELLFFDPNDLLPEFSVVYFVLTVSYQTQLPSVQPRIEDDQVIVWDQPSFDLVDFAEINKTDISYKVYIIDVHDMIELNSTTRDTRINVTSFSITYRCYRIEVTAFSTPESESERSSPVYFPEGCTLIDMPDPIETSLPPTTIESDQQPPPRLNNNPTSGLTAGLTAIVGVITVVLIIIVIIAILLCIIILRYLYQKKRKQKGSQSDLEFNIEDNTYTENQPRTRTPPPAHGGAAQAPPPPASIKRNGQTKEIVYTEVEVKRGGIAHPDAEGKPTLYVEVKQNFDNTSN